jgi:hypothetical protein
MTAAEFRRIALRMPEVVEGTHMGHADFRVAGKIFATLGYPDSRHGVVMLTPEEQREFLDAHPRVFVPAAGKWGESGSTVVSLREADATIATDAIRAAWRRRAPKPGGRDVKRRH